MTKLNELKRQLVREQQNPQRGYSAEEVHTIATAAFQVLFREIADLRAWVEILQNALGADEQNKLRESLSAYFQSPAHQTFRENVAQTISEKVAERLESMLESLQTDVSTEDKAGG